MQECPKGRFVKTFLSQPLEWILFLFTKINGILDIVHIIKGSHIAVCYRYTEVGTIRAGDIHRQLIMIILIDIVIGHQVTPR